MSDNEISDGAVEQLLDLLEMTSGIKMPPGDLGALSREFRFQIDAVRALEDAPEADEPILGFDPTWK